MRYLKFEILLAAILVTSGKTAYCQAKLCDGNGVCVFQMMSNTDMPSGEFNTKDPGSVERKMKSAAVVDENHRNEVCVVRTWTNGNPSNRKYTDLIAYKKPIDIVRRSDRKKIVSFQYVGSNDDAAVEAFNDVIFVDHDFTMYLIIPEHNCHGLPTSPTQYVTCRYCHKTYKKQEFYNSFTNKSLTIYVGAGNCRVTGKNCDDLELSDVPECKKIDCDQVPRSIH